MTDYRPPPPGSARRQPPPPPGTANRRKYPRYELLAQVELDRAGEVALLEVGNVSMGGLFVLADSDLILAAGDRVDVFIDLDDVELRAAAEVIRVTEAGVALSWQSSDSGTTAKLSRLLDHIRAMADD